MSGQSGHDDSTACPVAKQFNRHGGMVGLAIERSFDSEASGVIDVLG